MTDTKENKTGCGYGVWIIIAVFVGGAIVSPKIFFGSILLYILGIASIFALFWFVSMIFNNK